MRGELGDNWKRHLVQGRPVGGIFAAKIVCWLTVSPASMLLAPHPCLIYLFTSYMCSRRLRMHQGQVQRGGQEEGWEKRERENGQGPGGQLELMFLCFLLLICIDKMFFPPLTFFSFHYTPQNISGPILFLFSPCLLCHWSCFSGEVLLKLPFFQLFAFFFYSQLPFILLYL